jgi:hypothetical protein
MVKSVAMEGLRLFLFFLQADPCLVGESLWLVLHILDNWAVSELLVGPLLFVRSCHIENVSLVNSNGFTVPAVALFPVQA